MSISSLLGAVSVLASLAMAAPTQMLERQDCTFDSSKTPSCWSAGFNLDTNYYEKVPKGGKREYFFTLSEIKASPDGFERSVLAINGQVPGPTIVANWGDQVVVHLTNNLTDQGTGLHFHGIRQLGSNDMDGVPSITQCPTEGEGGTITYTWTATQYGTSWYHSHYGLQAWDGAFGAIQINGPASAPYNIDVGPVLLGDWMHDTAEHVFQTQGSGTMELGLINGSTNFGMTFQRNKTHRVRLINTSMDSVYKVSVDGHKMTVIANDLVPVVPAIVDSVTLVQGQRYDVIINASESVQSYFLRATTQTDCTSVGFADVKATVRYLNEDGSTPANFGAPPTTTGLPPTTDCTDGTFEPHLKVPVGPMSVALQDVNWVQNFPDVGPIFWSIKDVAYNSPWSYPTLQQVAQKNTTYDPRQQVLSLSGTSTSWIYVVIQSSGGSHPIHLHGHDFSILYQSAASVAYDPSNPPAFNTGNPPRRDVAILADGGFLVVAFQTDNPGAWLMHCHIGWHASQGMALTFLERVGEIKFDGGRLDDGCKKWGAWAQSKNIAQGPDSGI